MKFEDIINWFKEPTNLPWIIAGAIGIVFIIFFILFIVKAAKLSSSRKAVRDLTADKDILALNKSTLEKDLADSRATCQTLTAQLNEKSAAQEVLEKNISKLKASAKENEDSIASLKSDIESKDEKIKELDAALEESKKESAPEMLEPEVTPSMMVTAEANVEEVSTPTTPRNKAGMFKYTLAILNAVAEALGISKKKTKGEVITLIKYILADKKVTKSQVAAAMAIIGLPANMGDTKDSLIDQLKKELMK